MIILIANNYNHKPIMDPVPWQEFIPEDTHTVIYFFLFYCNRTTAMNDGCVSTGSVWHAADWLSERFCWRRHTCIGLTFHPRLIYSSGANLNDIVPPLPSLQRQDWASLPTRSSHVHKHASLDIYLCADIHRTFIEAMYCHLTLTITITTNPQPLTLTPTLTQTQF